MRLKNTENEEAAQSLSQILQSLDIAVDNDVFKNLASTVTGKSSLSEMTKEELTLLDAFVKENHFVFTKSAAEKGPAKQNMDYTGDFLERAKKVIEERRAKREHNRQKSE